MDQSQMQHQEQTQELHLIQEQIKEIRFKVDHVGETVEQMMVELTGNVLSKETGGMIKKVNAHEERILSLEKFRDRLIVIVVVASLFAGYGFWDLVHKLFKP